MAAHKNNHHSNKSKKVSKNVISEETIRPVIDEYRDMRSMIKVPINSVLFEKMAKELVEFAEDESNKAVRFSQYLRTRGIHLEEFRRLVAKSPILREAEQYAKMIMAERREIMGSTRERDFKVFARTQPHYCLIDREEAEWRAKLKEQKESEIRYHVTYDPCPSSPLVPELKKDKESGQE